MKRVRKEIFIYQSSIGKRDEGHGTLQKGSHLREKERDLDRRRKDGEYKVCEFVSQVMEERDNVCIYR